MIRNLLPAVVAMILSLVMGYWKDPRLLRAWRFLRGAALRLLHRRSSNREEVEE